ncbi:DUF4123 domain-containing protein [uncultured Deefgea sp.]|uniref:DUF4123 domain-containing protein n=1 Tax=uncultured Deefgea sp. TaxID=1304914 RepID=UPI002628C42F|nr:DUF4123 domain-containing protein [uncultured Deefgea sp.]
MLTLINQVKAIAHNDLDAHIFYVLIDQSAFPNMARIKNKLCHFRLANLVDLSTKEPIDMASPILVQLNNDENTDQLLEWLCTQGAYANGLCFINSQLAHKALAEALASRLDAFLPGKFPVLLRYFDTRILSELFVVLSEEQKAILTNGIINWWYVSRAGELLQGVVSNQTEIEAEQAIYFTEKQESMLIDLSTADSILNQLQTNPAEKLYQLLPYQQYALATQLLIQANSYAISEVPECTAFCRLGLDSAGAIYQEELWQQLLAKVKNQQLSFFDALDEMVDSLA